MAKIYAALAMKKTRPSSLDLRHRLSSNDEGDSDRRSFYDRLESDLLETSLVKLPAKAILGDSSAGDLQAKACRNFDFQLKIVRTHDFCLYALLFHHGVQRKAFHTLK